MLRRKNNRSLGLMMTVGLAAALAASAVADPLRAEEFDDPGARERCAVRVSISILGTSPSAALMSGDPQAQVEAMLQTPEFVERFARYVNSRFNDDPGPTSAEDASYHVAKYVLTNGRPWKDLFVGTLNIPQPNANQQNAPVNVVEDPNGLGYFRSRPWLVRYAGNEAAGARLSQAYRIMNNTVGLKLTATTNAIGADVSATGRQAPACKGCHYDGWSGLDPVAEVLGVVRRQNNNVTFQPYAGAAKPLFGGTAMVRDDKELVNALVASENFSYNSCSIAFSYLYGRRENVCEAQVFDKCIEVFKATGKIQSGLAAIAKDESFCE